MSDLLPATRVLLVELLEGLDRGDATLPELRVGDPGRSGSRYWLYGAEGRRPFETRRPFAQFDELRAAGLLRKLRKESTGTYFAFTPRAFDLRDRIVNQRSPSTARRKRPSQPPLELSAAEDRLSLLRNQHAETRAALIGLVELSSITEFRNSPGSGIFYVPINPWTWDPLPAGALLALGAARAHADAWLMLARGVIAAAASEYLEDFDSESDVVRSVYIRDSSAKAPAGDPARVIQEVDAALSKQLQIVESLPGAVEPGALLVIPDTNALLQDPALEDWVLGEETVWVVIAQQVVTELDAKKVDGNEKVRAKAETLIRRFREYGRRGDTLAGVKLAGNKMFLELPLAADMTLVPSLDPTHADDRILASALHLAALRLTSRVVLVTRDRNLQNKARFFRLPAVDVAEL